MFRWKSTLTSATKPGQAATSMKKTFAILYIYIVFECVWLHDRLNECRWHHKLQSFYKCFNLEKTKSDSVSWNSPWHPRNPCSSPSMPQVPAGCFRALRLPSGLLFRQDGLLLAEICKRWKNHDEFGPSNTLNQTWIIRSWEAPTQKRGAHCWKFKWRPAASQAAHTLTLQASIHSTDFLIDSFNPVCGGEIESAPTEFISQRTNEGQKTQTFRYKAPPFTTMPRRKRCKHRAHGSKPVYLAWQSWYQNMKLQPGRADSNIRNISQRCTSHH